MFGHKLTKQVFFFFLGGSLIWHKINVLFWLFTISAFFIYHLTIETILTQYQKIRDQNFFFLVENQDLETLLNKISRGRQKLHE